MIRFGTLTNLFLTENWLNIKPTKSINIFDPNCQNLMNLVETIEYIASDHDQEGKEGNISGQEDSDFDEESAFDDDNAAPIDIIQEIHTHIHFLVQLGPTLMRNLVAARKVQVEAPYPPIGPFHFLKPAELYASHIREKYRHAPERLLKRLGEYNWQIHQLVRNRLYGRHRLESRPNPIFVSLKDDPADVDYAKFHTTDISSQVEGERGLIEVPDTPKQLSKGEPFKCQFCGRLFFYIKNHWEWKSVYNYLSGIEIS